VLTARGRLGEVRREGAAFTAELRGLADGLSQESGRLYTAKCGADLGNPAWRGSGTVAALAGTSMFTADGLGAYAEGLFSAGRLGWSAAGRRPPDAKAMRGSKATGIDVVGNPDLLIDPRYFLQCGVSDFVNCGCLPYAKADDVLNVARRLNGGTVGLAQRKAWLAKWKAALAGPPEVVASPPLAPSAITDAPAAPRSGWAHIIAALLAALRRA
jgi:hypothetical protein